MKVIKMKTLQHLIQQISSVLEKILNKNQSENWKVNSVETSSPIKNG